MEFVETFLQKAREIAGYTPSDGAVLAVSGGADSMALLDLHRCLSNARIVVAHLDHHLRPDSADDAGFVREQAEAAGFSFIRGDWAQHRDADGIGLEAAARHARYRFLTSVAMDHGLSVVATGHHQDDQVETVLHRLIRGSGPEGLRGIHPRRPLAHGVTLVRPMLKLRRAEILEYLRGRGVPWRDDPTNRDGGNLRATIRARLLPFLKQNIPGLSDRLTDMARRCSETAWPHPPPGNAIDPGILDRPVLLRRAIAELLDEAAPPLEAHTMRRIRDALLKRSGEVDLGRGYTMAVRRAAITVRSPGEDDGKN